MNIFKKVVWMLFFCFIVAVTITPANADTLYSQPLLVGNTGPTSSGDYMAADDFLLGGNALITDLHWWGYYGSAVPDNDEFTIRFYEEDDGLNKPSLIPFYTATTASLFGLTRTDSGLSIPTGRMIYKYDTFLSVPVSILGGATYYVSIPKDISGSTWGWSKIETDGARRFWKPSDDSATDNYWRVVNNQNLAFELTSDAVIPEPSTMLLLGVGLVGLAGATGRKLKK